MKLFKQGKANIIFDLVVYGILLILLLVVAYPVLIVISSSFSSASAIMSGRVKFLPVNFTLDGYITMFNYNKIWLGIRNSAIYTVLGTLINVILTVLASYPLSREDLWCRKWITLLFLFSTWFSGGMMPTFLVMKNIGLLNTIWAMVIPGALTVHYVIILRTSFEALPQALRESAYLDGCSEFQYLRNIVLPLSKATIAVITLYYGVGHWNDYYNAKLYITENSLQPLQVILRSIILLGETQEMEMIMSGAAGANAAASAELLKYSSVVVATVPILLVYPLVQRHLVKGVLIGAVKG